MEKSIPVKPTGKSCPRERAQRREAGKKAQAIEHVPAVDNDGHGGCGQKRCAGGQQAYEYELHRPGIDGEADAERSHPGIVRLCQRGAECKAPKKVPKEHGQRLPLISSGERFAQPFRRRADGKFCEIWYTTYVRKQGKAGRFSPRFAKELEIKKETPQKVFAKSAKYITLILYAGACGRSVPCVRFFSFYKCPKGQEGE